jgi:cyclohexanecarboxylate-CoA ligase/acyl-CoA synthetase
MPTTTNPALVPADRYTAERIDAFIADGYWERGSLAAHLEHLADAAPDRPALTDGYGMLSRRELRDRAYRLARSLKRLGVQPGDRVQVQLPNWNEFVVIYLALARIGAVLVPTMPVYRDDEVAYVIEQSGAKLSFVTSNFRNYDYVAMIDRIRDGLPGLEQVVVVRGEATGDNLSFDDLIAGDDVPAADELGAYPDPDAAHAVIYTSGTESRPKGCQHTYATMSYTAHKLAQDVFRLTEDDVMLMPTPITHATGLAAGLMSPLLYGASVHLIDVWEPHDGLNRIEKYRTTVSMAATPFLQMALGAMKADPTHDMSSMRLWASAGAPIPEAMLRDWREHIPDCIPLPVYGNSEGLVVTAMQLDDPAEKIVSSDGRHAEGIELEIRDEDGAVLGAGEEGEIHYRSPGVMLGYWRDPDKTAAAFTDDSFFRTGDLGRIDEDGFLRVTGRIKDLIIRGGINISAREVEEHSVTHPAIEAIAAVSMPDEKLGEKVCAFIVPAGDQRITTAELADYLRNEHHIAAVKCPERIIFVESLPITATGKVQKFLLREQAAEAVRADHA